MIKFVQLPRTPASKCPLGIQSIIYGRPPVLNSEHSGLGARGFLPSEARHSPVIIDEEEEVQLDEPRLKCSIVHYGGINLEDSGNGRKRLRENDSVEKDGSSQIHYSHTNVGEFREVSGEGGGEKKESESQRRKRSRVDVSDSERIQPKVPFQPNYDVEDEAQKSHTDMLSHHEDSSYPAPKFDVPLAKSRVELPGSGKIQEEDGAGKVWSTEDTQASLISGSNKSSLEHHDNRPENSAAEELHMLECHKNIEGEPVQAKDMSTNTNSTTCSFSEMKNLEEASSQIEGLFLEYAGSVRLTSESVIPATVQFIESLKQSLEKIGGQSMHSINESVEVITNHLNQYALEKQSKLQQAKKFSLCRYVSGFLLVYNWSPICNCLLPVKRIP